MFNKKKNWKGTSEKSIFTNESQFLHLIQKDIKPLFNDTKDEVLPW